MTMIKMLLLVLMSLALFSSGCDLNTDLDFYAVNSSDGLYIARTNGSYIGGRLMNIYGIIRNSSGYVKNLIDVRIQLKDDHGNHLNTYTKSFGPVEPDKDIPLWIWPNTGDRPYATTYDLDIVEAIEYHNIPKSHIDIFQGYHDFSFTITDSSLTQSETSSLRDYTIKVNVTNNNPVDLKHIYWESFVYSATGMIADFDNENSSEVLKSGATTEIEFFYLLKESDVVHSVDIWGYGHSTE